MALDVAAIRASFPGFALSGPAQAAGDSLIATKLVEAEASIDRGLFASELLADAAVKYKTAHLLALEPGARAMKLVSADGSTLYEKTYKSAIRIAAMGYRVA